MKAGRPTTIRPQPLTTSTSAVDRAVIELTGHHAHRIMDPKERAAELRMALGLDEEATRLIELAITAAENSVLQEAIGLASRRGVSDCGGWVRSGYEMFRRSIIADLKRSYRPTAGR